MKKQGNLPLGRLYQKMPRTYMISSKKYMNENHTFNISRDGN